jgi:hypothetical protein
MATFKVLAGDFGEGKSGQVLVGPLYRRSGQGFNMPGGVHIGPGQIEALEIATEENLKKMGGAVGWGVAGGIALGPVGLIAGALAGGRQKEITFVCKFKDGRKFLGSCDAKVFADIKSAEFPSGVATVERSARITTVYSSGAALRQPCVEGRHYACGSKECSCSCHQKKEKVSFLRRLFRG